MSTARRGGRSRADGLQALNEIGSFLHSAMGQDGQPKGEFRSIPTADVHRDPKQPRLDKPSVEEVSAYRDGAREGFSKERLAQLEDLEGLGSTIEAHGLIQPIRVVVKPDGGYQLIAGERRWLAHILKGLTEIDAIVVDGSSAEEAYIVQVLENVQREDLTLWERVNSARRIAEFYTTRTGEKCTPPVLQKALGVGRAMAYQYHALLEVNPELDKALQSGRISSVRQAVSLVDLRGKDLEAAIETGRVEDKKEEPEAEKGKTEPPRVPTQNEKGRPREVIRLGKTSSSHVIRHIMQNFGKAEELDWADLGKVQKAWNAFLQELEKTLQQENPQ